MKTIIDNNYMINEYGYSIDENLLQDAYMNTTIFLKQVYHAVCDFVIKNNIHYKNSHEVEAFLDDDIKKETFKRALGLQAIYILENGDFRFLAGETENIAPAVVDIVRDNLKLYQRRRVLK